MASGAAKGQAEVATKPKRAGVLVVGATMVDVVCRVAHLPASGEGVVAEHAQAVAGGCAFNSACAARQVGADCVLFAPVGEGIYASFIEQALAARGLDTPLHIRGCDNGSCTCLVEADGQRTMITAPGVERLFERSWFDVLDAQRFSCGLASGYELEGASGDAIISFFEEHPRIQFYYAPGPRIRGVSAQMTERINALRPVWHLNDQEACAYTGCDDVDGAGRAIARACGNVVIVTAGAEGSHLFEADRHVLVPTQPVCVVDTVGAGDAHLGALVAARAEGHTWEEAVSVANHVAGAVCEVAGATLPCAH